MLTALLQTLQTLQTLQGLPLMQKRPLFCTLLSILNVNILIQIDEIILFHSSEA